MHVLKKISIIIPIYNNEEYLSACIDSVLAQTYKNLEIILINDGSTDSSGVICDEYALKDKRIIVKHQNNLGVSTARNVGISMSTGQYITFCDSDDYIAVDMYETLVNNIEFNEVDISACKVIKVYQNAENMPKKGKEYLEVVEIKKALFNVFYTDFSSYMCNKLFRREIFFRNEKLLEFDDNISIGEDTVFITEIFTNAKKIHFTDKALYYYRKHENSTTKIHANNHEKLICMLNYRANCSNIVKEHLGDDVADMILANVYKYAYEIVYSEYMLTGVINKSLLKEFKRFGIYYKKTKVVTKVEKLSLFIRITLVKVHVPANLLQLYKNIRKLKCQEKKIR